MNARILVLLAVLFFVVWAIIPPASNPQLIACPTYTDARLYDQNPINNPVIADESLRSMYDPTDNFMGDKSSARLANTIQDLAACTSEAALYQDTLGHVSLHNGNFYHTENLHQVPGRGFDFSFIATYSMKKSAVSGPLGLGWDHNYNARVSKTGTVWTLSTGFQQDVEFTQSPSNASYYLGEAGNYSTLFETPGDITIRNRFGCLTTFERQGSTGRLIAIRDSNDNAITFEYNLTTGFLETVKDTMHVAGTVNRAYTFNHTAAGKLIDITDFSGRKITFNVSAATDRLDDWQYPEVILTSTLNNFAGTNRKKKQFGYDGSNRLNTIKNPNEVATATTSDYVTVTYGNCAPLGDVVNSITIGTINYHTTLLSSPVVNFTFNTAVSQEVHVTDRNGNLTKYTFNSNGLCTKVVEPTEALDATTLFLYHTNREVDKVTFPRGNFINLAYATAPVTDFVYNLGNVTQIDFNRNSIASDQDILSNSFTYENLYNNCVTVTDPRNLVTSYTTDYFEQTNITTLVNCVTPELLNQFNLTELIPIFTGPPLLLGEVNGDGSLSQCHGNIIAKKYNDVTLTQVGGLLTQINLEGDATQEAGESWTYNDFGQITSSVDTEENRSFYGYFDKNAPTALPITTAGGGYHAQTVDDGDYTQSYSGTLAVRTNSFFGDIGRNSNRNPTFNEITSDYAYNNVGIVTQTTNGRGVQSTFEINQLDQVVLITRNSGFHANTATRGGGYTDHLAGTNLNESGLAGQLPFAYTTEFYFDYNNNIIANLVNNSFVSPPGTTLAGTPDNAIADTGFPGTIVIPGGSNKIEYYYYHDILDNLRQAETEVEAGVISEYEYEYDLNENRTLVRNPMAIANPLTMASNIENWDYTARDLIKNHIRAAGAIGPLCAGGTGPIDSTVSFDYDANQNLITFTDAVDNDGDLLNETFEYTYDGHDREKTTTNAVQTETEYTYDADSNILQIRILGLIDGSASVITEMQKTDFQFDEGNRKTLVTETVSVSTGVVLERAPVLDGPVITHFDFDRLNRNTFIIEDDLDIDTLKYDGSSRIIEKFEISSSKQI